MTEFDFYGKIKEYQNSGKKIYVEMDVVLGEPTSTTDSVNLNERYEKEKMENKNVNLEESANYLIQLFYKTGKKYSCTRTKIGKILSIVAFYAAQKNELLFNEPIYKYDNCGTVIHALTLKFDRDIYFNAPYKDRLETIEMSTLSDTDSIPERYLNVKSLSLEAKNLLQTAFIHFGAYAPITLGNCLNPIVDFPGVTLADGTIDLEKIKELSIDDFININDDRRPLIDFIFEKSTESCSC